MAACRAVAERRARHVVIYRTIQMLGGTVTVKVINWRNADLVELQKVLSALKAGQWTSAKLPQGNRCRVDLHGKFADGQSADASNVDVCAEKTVNLTN